MPYGSQTYGNSTYTTATPPLAPTGVTATQSTTRGEIDVSWDSDATANGYRVYRKPSTGSVLGEYTQVADVTTASYTDSGLTDGEDYFYRVTAYNTGGESPASNEASASTRLPAPGLTLDGGNKDVTVSYTFEDNNPEGVLVIERSDDGGASYTTLDTIYNTVAGSLLDQPLDAGATYTYRLTRNTDTESSQTTASVTTAPEQPTITGINNGTEDELTVSWTDTNTESSYNVYRATSESSTLADYTQVASPSQDVTSYTDTSLSDGTRYHYRVTAENSSGEGDPSADASAVTILPAPTVSVTGVGPHSIDVGWLVDADAGRTQVQYKATGTTTWATSTTTSGLTQNSATITGLEQSTQYDVRLVATTTDADSPSSVATATTDTETDTTPVQPYAWAIGGSGSNTRVVANGRLNGYSVPARGETIEWTFSLQDDPTLGSGEDRYRSLREYGFYPGQVGVTESEAGVPYFRERVAASPKNTHVVPIVPGDGVNDPGVWAAVQDVTETVPVNPSGYAEVTIEGVVLAEYSEYADRDTIGADRER